MFVCLHMYHGQILQDLDPISWSHVSHVVEVGWIGDQFVPHLGISQHFSGITDKDGNEVFPPYKDDANTAGSVKNTDRNHRAQAIISIGKQLRVTERGDSSFGEITANSPRAPGGEYRASGKLPPLLKSLLFGHSEGVASLVVHAAHHLLPAVV